MYVKHNFQRVGHCYFLCAGSVSIHVTLGLDRSIDRALLACGMHTTIGAVRLWYVLCYSILSSIMSSGRLNVVDAVGGHEEAVCLMACNTRINLEENSL